MIATFVIGLREGLEAALIVGIVAAFLRRNGRSLVPMWIGVAAALVLSLAVGVGLRLLERSLPQAAQEGLETVIGAVAVFFVTTMIVWMNAHARAMRSTLEHEAADALGRGSAQALAVMAFLAVLKEGFETAVFLLATFSAAQSAGLAALGAVLGVLVAVGIGWGLYTGGTRIDLGRFFRVTGGFLILVAAGLVVSTLRTAHEAGWISAGQQQVLDLSWLVAPGTPQSALITGVLGIPADPRAIEVVGWLAYLVPVTAFIYWPRRHRPVGRAVVAVQLAVAGALVATAVVLALAVPSAQAPTAATPLVSTSGSTVGSVQPVRSGAGVRALRVTLDGRVQTVPLAAGAGRPTQQHGLAATTWSTSSTADLTDRPTAITLDQVVAAAGRLPIGLSAQQDPGPFTARWTAHRTTTATLVGATLLDAQQQSTTVLELSGGGLTTPRTVTVSAADDTWQVPAATVTATAATLAGAAQVAAEHALWAVRLPLVLASAALVCALAALRRVLRARRAPSSPQSPSDAAPRSTLYVPAP